MVSFQHTRISRQLIEDLDDMIMRGESAVLVGPRHVGKRYILQHLLGRLQDRASYPVMHLKLMAEPPLMTIPQLRGHIHQALVESVSHSVPPLDPDGELLACIDRFQQQTGKPAILLASNVDGMAHHLARAFLASVRTHVEADSLIVVLGGEANFRDLVHGPKSEFNCANPLFLQGFDKKEFTHFVAHCFNVLGARFKCPDEALEKLFHLSGGNTHLVRLLLWSMVTTQCRYQGAKCEAWDVEGIPTIIRADGMPTASDSDILRYAARLIGSDPQGYSMLEEILGQGECPVNTVDNAPTTLELAGVALREGECLRFASPIMEDLVRAYFDDRRLGDLYARIGEWAKAFVHYQRLPDEQLRRPLSVDDKSELESIVSAVGESLYVTAMDGLESLKDRFVRGCKYVLGFSEVTFWHTESNAWSAEEIDGQTLPSNVIEELRHLLPLGKAPPYGSFPLPRPWTSTAVAAVLPASRSDRQDAVIVRDGPGATILSRERERWASELLNHFVKAYTHARFVARREKRLKVRDQHFEIVNSVFAALGTRVLDVRHALEMAAHGLRKLGYKRVLFCLVDPEHTRLRGVLDSSSDPDVDVAAMTDWPLDKPNDDLQPYVIFTRKPKIIEDARKEPLANQDVVQKAGMVAEAIVPILDVHGEAIGTIHVERKDGQVPSPTEVEDLETFGRNLASVIEQSERVNLLQSALRELPEPVLTVDSRAKVRYANQAASELLGVAPGWRDARDAKMIENCVSDEIEKQIRTSLRLGILQYRYARGVGKNPNYLGAIQSHPIHDFEEHITGVMTHIDDQNYLYDVLKAFQLVAQAMPTVEQAMGAMLEASRGLGFHRGRWYLVDQDANDHLVSCGSFSFDDAKDEQAFNSGKVILHRDNAAEWDNWASLDQGEPIVFCYNPKLKDREKTLTLYGLPVCNVRDPGDKAFLGKRPGDYWVDFPFKAEGKPLGKLTLDCTEELRPEHLELLKVLAEMMSGLLDALLRGKHYKEKAQWVQEAAETSMAQAMHNVVNILAPLETLLARYRLKEHVPLKPKDLRQLNDVFSHLLDEALATLRRVKERLVAVRVRPSQTDLVEIIRGKLEASFPPGSFNLDAPPSLQVEMDSLLLNNILVELIQNSRDIRDDLDRLHVEISINSVKRDQREWVRIIYRDNGPGVPTHIKECIFDNFVSYRPGRKPGTGMGLSFVRRAVEAHGGSVREQGRPGAGVEFVLDMPCQVSVEE